MSTTQFTLTHPDGRQWHGDSPLKVCAAAQRDLIPPDVAMKRITDTLKVTAEDEKEILAHICLVHEVAKAYRAWLGARTTHTDAIRKHLYREAVDAVEASARKLMGFAS